MAWIRLDTGIKRDPRIWALAADVGRDVGAVVGYVANLLAELPEHARDGDLTDVTDVLLESWAMWPGKRGVFAKAFVARLCDGRQVRAWEKHNGSALRQSDATRERVRAFREKRRTGTETPTGNAPETPCNALQPGTSNALRNVLTERDVTVRNETGRNEQQLQQQEVPPAAVATGERKRSRAVRPTPPVLPLDAPAEPDAAPAPPREPAPWEVGWRDWTRLIGPIAVSEFRKFVGGPILEPQHGEPPRATPEQFHIVIDWAAQIARANKRSQWLTPRQVGADWVTHARVLRMSQEQRVALLDAPRNGHYAGAAA